MVSSHIEETDLYLLMPLIRERLAAGHTVRFTPSGNSMLPMLRHDKDCVVLSPLPDELKKYDLPLYQRDDGQFVLHRVVKVGETYTCVGDNQYSVEEGLRKDQMIAVVTAFFRDGHEYSVDAPFYQLYCRFWHYTRLFRHLAVRGLGWNRRRNK